MYLLPDIKVIKSYAIVSDYPSYIIVVISGNFSEFL